MTSDIRRAALADPREHVDRVTRWVAKQPSRRAAPLTRARQALGKDPDASLPQHAGGLSRDEIQRIIIAADAAPSGPEPPGHESEAAE